jgi:peptidoglycan/LPS O-acetylase OafA/YrhL
LKRDLVELTALRFFAAFHVVLFHTFYLAGPAAAAGAPRWLLNIIGQGDAAVTLFFILSGFILTYSTDGVAPEKRRFWIARLSRIYPLYALAFLLDLPRVASVFLSGGPGASGLAKMSVAGLAHLGMLQSWHPRLTPTWNPPGWSISTEVFFYVVFPFVVPFMARSFRSLALLAALLLVPAILHALLLGAGVDLSTPATYVFLRSFPLLRLPEFLLGMALGFFFLRSRESIVHRNLPIGRIVAAAVLVSLGWICVPRSEWGAVLNQLVLVPCFCVLIFSLALGTGPLGHGPRTRSLVYLGAASYGLYITHIPLLSFFILLPLPASFLRLFSYLGACVLISCGLYRWVERPAQKWIRSRCT